MSTPWPHFWTRHLNSCICTNGLETIQCQWEGTEQERVRVSTHTHTRWIHLVSNIQMYTQNVLSLFLSLSLSLLLLISEPTCLVSPLSHDPIPNSRAIPACTSAPLHAAPTSVHSEVKNAPNNQDNDRKFKGEIEREQNNSATGLDAARRLKWRETTGWRKEAGFKSKWVEPDWLRWRKSLLQFLFYYFYL